MKSAFPYVGVIVLFVALFASAFSMMKNTDEKIQALATVNVVEPSLTLNFPVQLKFKRPERLNQTRVSVVKFNHFDHEEVSCTTCHHMWDGESQIQSCATPDCHDIHADKADPQSYFHVFHSLQAENSCRGCHVRLNQENEANLRVSPCDNNACHAKE